ncbi:hypothetical protein BV898_14556 [Hypsibius exemplaris]|uniref:Ubiquitin-like domain-containing protein n=1 Tax=Hypsibius exemplaris TaxID=2072580 RepID=A0A9X6N8U6_HYPEX|nr:hypothetical protein BV898_14556 [Hypsibius exemplaris]
MSGILVEETPSVDETVMEVPAHSQEPEDIKPDIGFDEDEKPDIEGLEKSTGEEEEIPEPKPERTYITIRVVAQDGLEMSFKISNTIKMEKIFKSFAERVKLAPIDIRFHHDGKRVKGSETPLSLGLEDDDEITANTEATGGCYFA